MKKIIFLIVFMATSLNAQVVPNNSFNSLFADKKATKIGDAITILVVESSQAANQAETSTGRTSDIGLNGSGGVGVTKLPSSSFSLGTKNSFKGSGVTKTSGMVKTRISALVDSVLGNGLVWIKGSRTIIINDQEQTVIVSGYVRTADISASNTVYSYNISDAKIVFNGSGSISRSQGPGWLTKLFHWLF